MASSPVLATMDAQRREIADGALVIEGNQIAWVGATADLAPDLLDGAATVIDARGRVVLPGFVNTHHHFYQTLTRAVPGAQDAVLFDWLKTLYPIWAELTPDDVFVSTQLALTELLLSGCTTSSDHHYLWPNGSRLDDQFAAAETIGVRFHGARGSMSLGESQGGLPPDRVTEPTKRRSCATAAAWSRASTTPAALPCAAWCWRPAAPSASRRT
jgi:cytosine/adenosine deaminase-related metal-dependent hydrolase